MTVDRSDIISTATFAFMLVRWFLAARRARRLEQRVSALEFRLVTLRAKTILRARGDEFAARRGNTEVGP